MQSGQIDWRLIWNKNDDEDTLWIESEERSYLWVNSKMVEMLSWSAARLGAPRLWYLKPHQKILSQLFESQTQ